MTPSTFRGDQGLTGSCPCSRVSWSTSISPIKLCICHCEDCRSSSSTKSPIPFAFFPNHAMRFFSKDSSSEIAELGTSNIGHDAENRAVRGSCKYCGSLIYMKYHSSADETDINMALCEDQSVVEELQGDAIHIFCKEAGARGLEVWREFSHEQRRNLEKWEEGGRKRRTDV